MFTFTKHKITNFAENSEMWQVNKQVSQDEFSASRPRPRRCRSILTLIAGRMDSCRCHSKLRSLV